MTTYNLDHERSNRTVVRKPVALFGGGQVVVLEHNETPVLTTYKTFFQAGGYTTDWGDGGYAIALHKSRTPIDDGGYAIALHNSRTPIDNPHMTARELYPGERVILTATGDP